jgi:hypothetical protein
MQPILALPSCSLAYLDDAEQKDPVELLNELFELEPLPDLRQKILCLFKMAATDPEPHQKLLEGNLKYPMDLYEALQQMAEASYLIIKLKAEGRIKIQYIEKAA